MITHPTARKNFTTTLVGLSAVAAAALFGTMVAAPASDPPRVRLGNPVEVAGAGLEVDAVAVLPDNESVVVVGGKPRGPGDGDRATEDAPPAGAIVNLKTKAVRPFTNGHTARIKSVAASADGSRIFTVCSDKDPFVRVWDVKAGKPFAPISLPRFEDYSGTYEVACVPGSRKIAVAVKECVALIDPDGHEQREDLTAEDLADDTVKNLAVSPDGKFLACFTTERKIVVWDIRVRKVACSLSLVPDGEDYRDWLLFALAFTRDGTRLIAARSGKADEVPSGTAEEKVAPERRGLFVIDVGKQQVAPLGMGHPVRTHAFALHPSEHWIATLGPSRPDRSGRKGAPDQVGELRIYPFPTRSVALRVQFDDGFFPHRVRFTPDGRKVVAVDYEGKVRGWEFVPAGGEK